MTYSFCKVLVNKDHAMWKGKIYWNQTAGCHSQVQSEAAWLKMGSGLYRKGQAMGEGESFWS
jgi:hypothetical protein